MIVPYTKKYRTLPEHNIVNNLPGDAQVLLSDFHYLCNRRTKQLNPKILTLAERHGWSYSKAAVALRKLRDCGIIRAIRGWRGSTYEIRPTDEWRPPLEARLWPRRHRERSVELQRCDSTDHSAPILIDKETFFSEREEGSTAAAAAGEGLNSVAAEAASSPFSQREQTSPTVPPATGGEPPWEEEAEALVSELTQTHPKPGHRSRSIPILAGILRRSGAPEETKDQIRSSHTQWLRYWQYEPARALHLWFWLESKEYLDPPAEAAIRAAHMKSMSFKELEQYRKLLTLNAEIDAKMAQEAAQEAKTEADYERAKKAGRIVR